MNTCTDGRPQTDASRPQAVGTKLERIIYVAPDVTDAAVKKRAHGFMSGGHDLLSFSFRRHRYNVGRSADWPNVELGTSRERRLGSRILLCLASLWKIFRYRRRWRDASMVYARNLDLAVLSLIGRWITWSRAPLVYEVLDIHPVLTGNSWKAETARWIERRVLAGCQLLVVSSPAFLHQYFRARQGFHGEALILENKWTGQSMPRGGRTVSYPLDSPRPVWSIGWFGNLRCRESLQILTALADALPNEVKIYMRGCDSLLGDGTIARTINGRSNMVFAGEYDAPDELPNVYTGIHFNWCIDLSDGDNSCWLIPNRIYEGGYYGIPALAIRSHETGRIVEERRLGMTVESPYVQNLVNRFRSISREQYQSVRTQIEQRDAAEFIDTRDTATLIRRQVDA